MILTVKVLILIKRLQQCSLNIQQYSDFNISIVVFHGFSWHKYKTYSVIICSVQKFFFRLFAYG